MNNLSLTNKVLKIKLSNDSKYMCLIMEQNKL